MSTSSTPVVRPRASALPQYPSSVVAASIETSDSYMMQQQQFFAPSQLICYVRCCQAGCQNRVRVQSSAKSIMTSSYPLLLYYRRRPVRDTNRSLKTAVKMALGNKSDFSGRRIKQRSYLLRWMSPPIPKHSARAVSSSLASRYRSN